jgi:hypothetical protein
VLYRKHVGEKDGFKRFAVEDGRGLIMVGSSVWESSAAEEGDSRSLADR